MIRLYSVILCLLVYLTTRTVWAQDPSTAEPVTGADINATAETILGGENNVTTASDTIGGESNNDTSDPPTISPTTWTMPPDTTENATSVVPTESNPPTTISPTTWTMPPDTTENVTSVVPTKSTTEGPDDSDYFETECSTDSNCTEAHAICDMTKSKCRCHVEDKWKRSPDKNKCMFQAEYNQPCNDDTVCVTANATCAFAGILSSPNRCRCVDNNVHFVAVESSGTFECVKVLTTRDNAACAKCISNEGICYEENGSTKCKCTVSRSGKDCEVVHVHVQCSLDGNFAMSVCYDPHEELKDNQKVWMYPSGKGMVRECIAEKLTANSTDNFCAAGSYYLELPMGKDERDKCGIREVQTDRNTKKNEVTMEINDPTATQATILAKTYCQFTGTALQSSGAITLESVNGNDNGQDKRPQTSFNVMLANGEKINPYSGVMIGDEVKFQIMVVEDGVYVAVLVESCMASSSGSYPDPKADTRLLFVDGCPVAADKGGVGGFVFSRLRERTNIVSSETVKMFKLAKGNTVFIHCLIKLCLVGSEDECVPMNKTQCDNKDSMSRKRRAVEEGHFKETQIALAVPVNSEGQESGNTNFLGMSTPGFATIIGLLVLLVLVALVVASIVVYKIKTKNNKIGDNVELTNKPQRFALPRVQRNHMRI